jgi:hypothetical protein
VPDFIPGDAAADAPVGLDDLAARLAGELGPVYWLEPAEIRTRARRRRLRAIAAAPVVVVLLLVGGWGVWSGWDRGRAVPAVAVTGSPATSASSPVPSATGNGSPSFAAADWIPVEAIVQPEDVGAGYQAYNDFTYLAGSYPAWTFDLGCPGFDNLHLTAYQRYRFMRGRNVVAVTDPEKAVIAEVERYPSADAAQVMLDIKAAVHTCARYPGTSEASSDLRPAHAIFEWSVLGSGFAGQDSLLLQERVTSVDDTTGATIGPASVQVYAVVRVADLVTIVDSAAFSPSALRAISVKAAARLCQAALPRC